MNQSRPKVRLSRALGIALTPKCVKYFERRPFPPGVHGRRRRNQSDYAVRLMEKQRLRHQYNLSEGQLSRTFKEAARRQGATGENLIALLEQRLDAVVLRAGLARTIYQARQIVSHQHIVVNGRRVDKPSFRTRAGDVVEIAERSRDKTPFQVAAAGAHAPAKSAPYLSADLPNLKVTVLRPAARTEVPVFCDTQLVVEFYSR